MQILQAIAEDVNGKLKVYLRVRPLKPIELEKGEDQVRSLIKQLSVFLLGEPISLCCYVITSCKPLQ